MDALPYIYRIEDCLYRAILTFAFWINFLIFPTFLLIAHTNHTCITWVIILGAVLAFALQINDLHFCAYFPIISAMDFIQRTIGVSWAFFTDSSNFQNLIGGAVFGISYADCSGDSRILIICTLFASAVRLEDLSAIAFIFITDALPLSYVWVLEGLAALTFSRC